jgi:hypothetical protein
VVHELPLPGRHRGGCLSARLARLEPSPRWASGNCDPAYLTICIPPLSVQGDLNCKDIPHRRFTVLPPDPHNFDGDYDGIGCES